VQKLCAHSTAALIAEIKVYNHKRDSKTNKIDYKFHKYLNAVVLNYRNLKVCRKMLRSAGNPAFRQHGGA